MVTDGGGWTAIINPQDYQKSYLDQFPAQVDTIVNYGSYTSPAQGVSWGDFTTAADVSNQPHKIELNLEYNELKVTYSGFYNNPTQGLGFLFIGNQESVSNAINFNDSHTTDIDGQSLSVNDTLIFEEELINVTDRTDTISLPNSTLLQISMNAFTSNYPYTARYIRELWIR